MLKAQYLPSLARALFANSLIYYYYFNFSDIGAFWVQTQLNQYLQDPLEAQKLEEQVLQILIIPDEKVRNEKERVRENYFPGL